MSQLYALIPNAITPEREGRIYAEVASHKPPASLSDPLHVVKPDWDPHYYWTIHDWPKLHGRTLPAPGMPCMLELDSRGNMRCLWWGSGGAVDLSTPSVSSLPAAPTDGQEVCLVADATNGVTWRFRYRAASSSAYRWEFVGGPPMQTSDGGAVASTTSATFVEADTACRVTIPSALRGDFISSATGSVLTTTASTLVQLGLRQGGGGDSAISEFRANATADLRGGYAGQVRFNGVSAGAVFAQSIRNGSADGNSISYKLRTLSVLPVRVG